MFASRQIEHNHEQSVCGEFHTAHVWKEYAEISHILLTLRGDFNSIVDKGA